MTSERGEVIFSKEETLRIKSDISKRILEILGYQLNLEIASLLKTNVGTISSFLKGEEFPSTEILLSIHKITSVSIHWLLTGNGAKILVSTKIHSSFLRKRKF